ncbi:Hypothetical predicted protein, partial [Paramuricea clavata]
MMWYPAVPCATLLYANDGACDASAPSPTKGSKTTYITTEPPQLGQYKSIVYGKCHIRGHRTE